MTKNGTPKDQQLEEWLRHATADALTLKSLLKHRDASPSSACFFAHQLAEKFLKAFLLHYQGSYPKIHPLDKLWEYCFDLDQSLDSIKDDCVFLTPFYLPSRYPGDDLELTWPDAEDAAQAAEKIRQFVATKLPII